MSIQVFSRPYVFSGDSDREIYNKADSLFGMITENQAFRPLAKAGLNHLAQFVRNANYGFALGYIASLLDELDDKPAHTDYSRRPSRNDEELADLNDRNGIYITAEN